MPQPPRVTVVALCYNHERFVERCLASIQAQTFQDFELIVVDDASTDRSRGLVERWIAQHRPATNFLAQPINRGVCAVLNIALAAAHGRYFALVATDDEWEPNKLERQVGVLSRQPDAVAMVYSDASRVDVEGNRLTGGFIETARPGLTPPSGDLISALTVGNFIPAMSTLIRVDALRALGGYDESLAFEDYDMWLRIASRYGIVFVPGELARYRIVPGSLIHTMLTTRRVGHAVTYCRMAMKHVQNPRLGPEQQALWRERLASNAHDLFDIGAPQAAQYLRVVARLTRTPKSLMTAAAATIGISRRRLDHIAVGSRKLLRRSERRPAGV